MGTIMQALRMERCEDQAHVYWADLDDAGWHSMPATVDDHLLSPHERMRASRFQFEGDRHRYVLAHLLLRNLIAGCIGDSPGALVFQYSSHGKPRLAPNGTGLHFNLAHSGGIAVFALASTEIGVDTETASAESISQEVAHMYLSEAESIQLDSLPAIERKRACLQVWTRKEALLKGLGIGLIDDLRDVSVGWPKTPALVRPSRSNHTDDWVIREIGPFHRALGALAYRRRHSTLINCQEFCLLPSGGGERSASTTCAAFTCNRIPAR
jgi:4'-phosphopantetheinyl transferase